ncbi:small GTPase superfamily, Rab type, partial [Kipferlia bialata]
YDITNFESFQNVEDWYAVVQQAMKQKGATPPKVSLVANKSDLAYLRTVRDSAHRRFCDENNLTSHVVSAKNGDYVQSMFMAVAAQLTGVKLSADHVQSAQEPVTAQVTQEEGGRAGPKPVDLGRQRVDMTGGSAKDEKGCVCM